MASPPNDQSKYDAIYDWAGLQIFNFVRQNFDPHTATILDVGAGWGKYSYLFPDFMMDANEIWGEYIVADSLYKKYRTVNHGNILAMEIAYYDIIIMGDVLEHIERKAAQNLVANLVGRCKQLIVVVPFEYVQHPTDANIYEEHLQADLTPELMRELYPQLKLLKKKGNRGVYIK